MNILTIDTTTSTGMVGIYNQHPVIETYFDGSHSVSLVPQVESVLHKTSLTINNIKGISIAIGPGSFTGLRSGLSFAKALAFALDIPLAGVSSLEVLSFNAEHHHSPGLILSLLNAHRGELFGRLDRSSSEKSLEPCIEEKAMTPADWAKAVEAFSENIIVVGDGTPLFLETVSFPRNLIVPEKPDHLPHVEALAQLALATLEQGGDQIETLVPHYLRRSDAEAKHAVS